MTSIRKSILALCILAAFSGHILAQHYRMHPEIPVDSSYNVNNEYKKHSKKYPFIAIATVGDTSKLSIHRDICYHQINNRELHLDIIQPKPYTSKKRLPAVILIHGGGWRSGDKSMDMPMACELARNGFIAIMVEYRLSMEALYPAAIQDIKTAIRWIKLHAAEYRIHPGRLALLGTSAGGQMASLIGSINHPYPPFEPGVYTKVDDKVKAVVDIDGVLAFIHPESGEGKDQPGKPSASTLWFGKPLALDSLSRIEASALTHVNKKSARFLFICSSQDRFHGGRDDMMARLKSFHIYSETHTLPETPHTIWLFHPWFSKVTGLTLDFLNNQL